MVESFPFRMSRVLWPTVVYYGLGEWTVPLSLAQMIDSTEGVEDPC